MKREPRAINADFAEVMQEWLRLQRLDANPDSDTRSIAEKAADKIRLKELAEIINKQAGVIARRIM